MDGFFTTLTLSFSPQIFFAILGATLGSIISTDVNRYGWFLSLMFILASMSFGAAMGEYLYLTRGVSSVFWLFALNIPLGMVVGSTIDVIRIVNRPLIEKLVEGIATTSVNILIDSIVKKMNKWFGASEDKGKNE